MYSSVTVCTITCIATNQIHTSCVVLTRWAWTLLNFWNKRTQLEIRWVRKRKFPNLDIMLRLPYKIVKLVSIKPPVLCKILQEEMKYLYLDIHDLSSLVIAICSALKAVSQIWTGDEFFASSTRRVEGQESRYYTFVLTQFSLNLLFLSLNFFFLRKLNGIGHRKHLHLLLEKQKPHTFLAIYILILKTIGNRKGDCAWSCSRWQTQPEKICKSQRTNQCHSLCTLYWFALCNLLIFSGCVCPLEQLHAQSPFLFPISFCINLIPFFDVSSVDYLLFFHPGCSGMCCFTCDALLGPLRGRNSCCLWFWQLVFGVSLRAATSNLPSSPNPLSNSSVLHDGRKHKTVVFSQSNALRE